MMKLGIYMGSFNPPHKGHIKIVNYLLDNKYVDKVLIIPTLNYWNKNNLVDIKDRINMLKFYESDNIIIDSEHNQYIYTYELVKEIEKKYPNFYLTVIIGADNIVDLCKWKNYEKLIKYHFIIVPRDSINVNKYLKKLDGNFTILKNYPKINISSSELREKINSDYLDKDVLNYIKKNHLYE